MNASSIMFPWGLPVATVAGIAAFLVISVATCDPHWLNRGGNVVAACVAVAVIFQVRSEIAIEKATGQLDAPPRGQNVMSSAGPVGRKARELHERRNAGTRILLTEERLQMVKIVVMCTLVGTLLEGFGDVALEWLFASYFVP